MDMTLGEFLNTLLEVAIEGGIATAIESGMGTELEEKAAREKFASGIIQLKRGCGCYIESDEEFAKGMPFYKQLEDQSGDIEYAEIGRNALREVAPCCLAAILLRDIGRK